MNDWLSDETLQHLRELAGGPAAQQGRYEILERIGQGGMGVVYRARDQNLGRDVALKILREHAADPLAEQRLRREAEVIARLEHPGIAPVYDVGRLDNGALFYVMKLVRGRSLDQAVRAVSPLPQRLRFFQQICETVAFAHAHGVIHRDLKPQNVMLGEFGEVLVLDWGTAKLLRAADADPALPAATSVGAVAGRAPDSDTTTRATAHGTIIGTPAYMSPEQARGEIATLDERADVYALGAILYFLLTDAPPRPAGASNSDASLPLESPRKLQPATPRPLAAVCMKALARVAAERYPSAVALRDEIARYLAGQAVQAYSEPWHERLARVARPHRTAIILVVTYLLARAALLFWPGR